MFMSFVIEHTVVNLVALLIGAAIGVGLVRALFKSSQSLAKALIVALGSLVAGLWSYSTYDIPLRPLEFREAAVLSIGMFGVPFIVAACVYHLLSKVGQRKEK